MELSSSIIKKNLYFLIFWETETPKKIPYISGRGTPKKRLIFLKMELFRPSSTLTLKNFLYFLKRRLFLYSGNGKRPP